MDFLHNKQISLVAAVWFLVLQSLIPAGVQSIGVCYGTVADNLPPAGDVVSLYKSNNINRMRIYSPDSSALQALKGSNIDLIVGVLNEDLRSLAGDSSAATSWVQNNIQAYPDVSFRYIAVGNEVIPGDKAQFVLPAMQNIQAALSSAGLNQIKVSTAIAFAIDNSFPPSHGTFSSDAASTMAPIVQFLANTGAPLLVNVYPYLSYVGGKNNIRLDYALFTSPSIVVNDPDSQLNYQNLFDAMVDGVYAALEKTGGGNVGIVVSETGWPSAGDDSASPENAQTYNQNLINHVGNGTPKRAGELETYIFAMFNEDLKQPQGIENNWGLFYPNKQPVYSINFN